jgi:hypothetical protein
MIFKNRLSILAKINSPISALLILIGVTMIFSGGQEIFAIYSPHDDYYFIMRTKSFLFSGHSAAIKEYLYSAFVRVSRLYSISLRDFEVICYGIAVFCLWRQLSVLMKSYTIAWIAILPLALFSYQHPVFNRATYDALQLILTPLTIATSLQIIINKGNSTSLFISSLIVGLQILTRPEGLLFILPPLIAMFFVIYSVSNESGKSFNILKFCQQAVLVCLLPVIFQQGMSATNQAVFGFWAPTIMKSTEFKACLSALMSIKPSDNIDQRYAPFPISSMQQAYDVSPSFLKAKPFFDQNISGQGWSVHARPDYRNKDGSIGGGHLLFALLDASAFVAGENPIAMLAYLKQVSEDIRIAFDEGKLVKRSLLSTWLGPDFYIVDAHFWKSISRIGSILLGFGEPNMPRLAGFVSTPSIEADYNRLTLRKTALLETQGWKMSGWLLNMNLGFPDNIKLDQIAQMNGVILKVIERHDVAKIVLHLDPKQAVLPLFGFELSASNSGNGNLLVKYPGHVSIVPLEKLKTIVSNNSLEYDGLHIQIDNSDTVPFLGQKHFKFIEMITVAAHFSMRFITVFSIAGFVIIVYFRKKIDISENDLITLCMVVLLGLSIALPRLGVLSAIDANMYPGDEPRYLAAAAFSVWFVSTFILGCIVNWLRKKI